MKASNFTDAQMAFIIKQTKDGTPVAEVCRKAENSQATYFTWEKKSAALMPSEMKRLRELEQENARQNKIVAIVARTNRASMATLPGRGRWSTRCGRIGACRSAGPVR